MKMALIMAHFKWDRAICPADSGIRTNELRRQCLPILAGRLPCSKQEDQKIGHELKERATCSASLSNSLDQAMLLETAVLVSKACTVPVRPQLASAQCAE